MGLPQGTVTLLFTDLEGSTRRWEAHPAEMKDALAPHNRLGLGMTLERAAAVLARLGYAEPAAVLAGAVSAHFPLSVAALLAEPNAQAPESAAVGDG